MSFGKHAFDIVFYKVFGTPGLPREAQDSQEDSQDGAIEPPRATLTHKQHVYPIYQKYAYAFAREVVQKLYGSGSKHKNN